MASLTRARSLRKPTGPTALPPRERPREQSQGPDRNVSPSRLPTKPALRPTSSSTTTTTAPTRSTSGRAHRPGSASSNASSVAAPTRSVSLRKKSATTAPEHTAAAAAAPPPAARKDTHRYPPLSSATRPNSMVLRPTSAGSATATSTTSTATRRAAAPTHARANSAAVTTGAAAPSAARNAPPPAAQERKSRSRPPSRDPTTSATTAAAAAAAAPSTPKRRAVSVDKPPPITPTAASHTPRLQHRPVFMQQQQQRLSPGKTSSPRPPTAQQPPLSPSKPPANVAASAETARLQAELLQLHLLHRDAGTVEAQWHASAKTKLGERFRELRDAHRALADREAAEIEGDNIAALQCWGGGIGAGAGMGTLLDGRIQALDAVISGVWALSEPGGKYARVVRRFERWVERVMDLEEARDSGAICLFASGAALPDRHSLGNSTNSAGGGGGSNMQDALFLQDLDRAWTDDCASMTRKLEGWQDQLEQCLGGGLEGLGSGVSGGGGSSLARMLDGAGSLVGDMLAELGAMEEIRQAALAREEDWIEAMNRDDDENDTPRAGAVWRAM
ncbi:hypothetical protein LEL_09799 [Akanthomyces lecanii RCEF 1005]|uniref:AGA1 A-agglutinin anchor subunit n=1 Tax=Akanthomyces lecanii RCEF 1005 TaxID=1081108 RepID=A0A168BDS4_CORDF|nr:hypothetical protein LEL_09799 [Akanthomyces lecanii RCEF 1005]